MKALTIRHPWPWAICYLGKDIENRTWLPTQSQLRAGERFAIHAGKMPSLREIQDAFEAMRSMGCIGQDAKLPTAADLRRQESGIVAVATYGGWVSRSPSKWFVGPYGWVLRDVLVLPNPLPGAGALKLWEVDGLEEDLEQMRAQFRGHGDKG